MESRSCGYCGATVYGRGVEVMLEHYWECEAYLEQMMEEEGLVGLGEDDDDSDDAEEED